MLVALIAALPSSPSVRRGRRDFKAGIGGVLVLILLAQLISLAFGSIGLFFGAQTGCPEAVQGLFPLLFVTFFLARSTCRAT